MALEVHEKPFRHILVDGAMLETLRGEFMVDIPGVGHGMPYSSQIHGVPIYVDDCPCDYVYCEVCGVDYGAEDPCWRH